MLLLPTPGDPSLRLRMTGGTGVVLFYTVRLDHIHPGVVHPHHVDPQLHIHNGLLNRVQGPDGVWRTIDGRGLFRWRPAAAAVMERTTTERLTNALGVLATMRPDGKAREIVGVAQEAMDLISTRRRKLGNMADTGLPASLRDVIARSSTSGCCASSLRSSAPV